MDPSPPSAPPNPPSPPRADPVTTAPVPKPSQVSSPATQVDRPPTDAWVAKDGVAGALPSLTRIPGNSPSPQPPAQLQLHPLGVRLHLRVVITDEFIGHGRLGERLAYLPLGAVCVALGNLNLPASEPRIARRALSPVARRTAMLHRLADVFEDGEPLLCLDVARRLRVPTWGPLGAWLHGC